MNKLLLVVGVLIAAWLVAIHPRGHSSVSFPGGVRSGSLSVQGSSALAQAFERHAHALPVQGAGVVVRSLADDTEGSRHQRILVRLDSGQTILLAHNIDLAPRIESVASGMPIGFSGEYEWNERGGVVHWTHRDPQGRHRPGWIEYQGRRYQ